MTQMIRDACKYERVSKMHSTRFNWFCHILSDSTMAFRSHIQCRRMQLIMLEFQFLSPWWPQAVQSNEDFPCPRDWLWKVTACCCFSVLRSMIGIMRGLCLQKSPQSFAQRSIFLLHTSASESSSSSSMMRSCNWEMFLAKVCHVRLAIVPHTPSGIVSRVKVQSKMIVHYLPLIYTPKRRANPFRA